MAHNVFIIVWIQNNAPIHMVSLCIYIYTHTPTHVVFSDSFVLSSHGHKVGMAFSSSSGHRMHVWYSQLQCHRLDTGCESYIYMLSSPVLGMYTSCIILPFASSSGTQNACAVFSYIFVSSFTYRMGKRSRHLAWECVLFCHLLCQRIYKVFS